MSKDREAFIEKYKWDVIEATRGTGIFPSVKMAQMIIESADSAGRSGKGITAVQAKNFFGIKADPSWKGPKMAFNTPKDASKVNYFRVYETPKDSIADHTLFLKKNSRYERAGVFSAKTPEDQVRAIASAGYAESPTYAQGLIAMINAYKLKELDNLAKLPFHSRAQMNIAIFFAVLLIISAVLLIIYRKKVAVYLTKL